jgi:hypothetical protein
MRTNEVTQQHIETWKRLYGAVYKVKIAGQEFYFRPIMRHEMLQIQEWLRNNPDATVGQMDEKVVDYCLLAPDWKVSDFLAMPAGVLSTLSRRIQERSGFEDDPPTDELFNNIVIPPLEPDKIEEFKKSYPRFCIVTMRGLKFAVRAINRVEWDRIQRHLASHPELDADAEIAKLALLHPDAQMLDSLPAGYVLAISAAALRVSGFNEEPEVEEVL